MLAGRPARALSKTINSTGLSTQQFFRQGVSSREEGVSTSREMRKAGKIDALCVFVVGAVLTFFRGCHE